MEEEMAEAREKKKSNEALGKSHSPRNIIKRVFSTQATINMFKKGMREEACQEMAKFLYNNTILFNVSKSEGFSTMFDLASRLGLEFKHPSYHDIKVN